MKAIVNGEINTITNGTFKGNILIENGKIKEIGEDVFVPDEAEVVDAEGKTVMPGLIDAHCHTGIDEEAEGWAGNDTNERYDPVTCHLRAMDGINPFDLGLQDAVKAGITTVNIGPGSANPIGGQFAALKTAGSEIIDQRIVREPVGMKMATGENPKRVYGDQSKVPSTRIGTAGVIRKTLFDAKNYFEKKKEKEDDDENGGEENFKYESLEPLFENEIPARVHAHRADDIVTATRIMDEFGIDLVIEHCTEGHKVADYLAEKEIPAIVGPHLSSRSKRELRERTFKTAGVLADKGVKVAIMTDSPVVPIQYLPLMAAYAVREGMSEEEALEAITINPAEICGIDDRVGSLEEGKDADIIIVDGEILDLKAKIEKVFVEGEEVEIENMPQQGEIRTY
ncbi:MAG: amidohydrolase [Candidatus Aenigmatarchaeota archaeon]